MKVFVSPASTRTLAICLAMAGAGLPMAAAAQTTPGQAIPAGDFADDGVTFGAGPAAGVVGAQALPQAGDVGAGAMQAAQQPADAMPQPAPVPGVVDQAAAPVAPYPGAAGAQEMAEQAGGGGAAAVTGGGEQPNARRIIIAPYIEAGQTFYAGIKPAEEVLTYSSIAAGVDATINGRNTQGTVSLRYEHQIGWGRQNNADVLSGVARMSTQIVPGTLQIDYGAFADRAYIASNGAALPDAPVAGHSLSQIWSVFAGPTLNTHVGDVDVLAHYRFGFTQEGAPVGDSSVAQANAPDSFARAQVHDAGAMVGFKPGTLLPIGLAAEGGYYHEDISLLGQHVDNAHVRGIVTVPVTPTLQVVGAAGAEHVKVSSYNAVVDASGNPVLDGQGHYISDNSSPRIVAYDTSGLIWDVGVVWRPSPRTALDMHYGRRYGGYGAWGSFAWTPNNRNAVNVSVYDNLVGFGGDLTGALAGAPTAFAAIRDPISGNLSSCVATTQGGGCIASVLGSVNGLVYRDRGVTAQYSHNFGRIQSGLAAGYDNREYIAGASTVLGAYNGKTDQYYWAAAFASDDLGPHSNLSGTVDVYRFESGLSSAGDATGIHASGTYRYRFTRHLTASATLAVDGINSQALDDVWAVSGALALRYTF